MSLLFVVVNNNIPPSLRSKRRRRRRRRRTDYDWTTTNALLRCVCVSSGVSSALLSEVLEKECVFCVNESLKFEEVKKKTVDDQTERK